MTSSSPQAGASLVLGLRGPLARIELLAGRLMRAAATPAEREIGESISAAVSELDGLVGRLLELFAPPAGASDPVGPVGPVLDDAVARVIPALEARGLACRRDRAGDGIVAGLATARRAAIELLDRAARGLPRGAVLRLGAREQPGGATLVVAVEGAVPADGSVGPPLIPEGPRVGRDADGGSAPVFERALGAGAGGCTAS